MKNIIFSILLLWPFVSYTENLTTNEYYVDGKLRRSIVYDENLNILSEVYFRQKNSMRIAKIEYKTKDSLKRAVFYDDDGIEVLYDINFVTGKYVDTKNQIVLSFKGNFIFDGKQIGKHIVANYRNNKRTGPVL